MKITHSILEAISFSARAHHSQFRKDDATPYHAHPMRVATIAAGWGVEDESTLIAALLHDTIEDTTTDWDDITKKFGPDAANLVAALTKDSRLPEAAREDAYYATLAAAEWRVRVAKMADGYDNLLDSAYAIIPTQALFKAEKALVLLAHGNEQPIIAARTALMALVAENKARTAGAT
jgi:guanosine-3',5'-bis(diphosphate) 3'-pyrophosphohydrolase